MPLVPPVMTAILPCNRFICETPVLLGRRRGAVLESCDQPPYRKFGAGREGRVEHKEEDGLGDISDIPQRFIGTIAIISP